MPGGDPAVEEIWRNGKNEIFVIFYYENTPPSYCVAERKTIWKKGIIEIKLDRQSPMGISGRKKEFSPFFRFHFGFNEVESVTIAIDLNNENKRTWRFQIFVTEYCWKKNKSDFTYSIDKIKLRDELTLKATFNSCFTFGNTGGGKMWQWVGQETIWLLLLFEIYLILGEKAKIIFLVILHWYTLL